MKILQFFKRYSGIASGLVKNEHRALTLLCKIGGVYFLINFFNYNCLLLQVHYLHISMLVVAKRLVLRVF